MNYIPIFPLIANIFAAFFCLGCSAAFHLLHVKSVTVFSILSRLDYGGISVLILGSVLPTIFYGFACQPEITARWIWTSIMIAGCIGCFVASLLPKFDSPKFRPVRGIMFILMGCSPIGIFIAILAFSNEWKMPVSVTWFAIGGYIYI